MNFSSHDRPQNGDFVRKFDFKISIFGFYRDALKQFNSIRITPARKKNSKMQGSVRNGCHLSL
ncbi:hypothetical protein BWD12_15170 [Leptospira santarosai serovar Bananal]|uniref:Uncharacterized protein n=1 Tax=Leptospira santarosai TaxID=28183 RepID=A0AB73LP86_9LEPT|nr:hypothetical protein BV917_02080 [Leptospira santarosai serovar Guaricura]OLY65955.1 hypothetical protein BWD11_00580 [Leptospira santarosai serovar Grippotyphosa]ONF77440.1 hypothetical protein BWD12_15170 [Leptospira santarosai serovar Bananal]ONF84276.1 hypothetical protein BWD13_16565 [Leptospira santarosai serovar Grippotyphosa]ONF94240.1 hypothetical protein BWD14_02840 [Leptospira santarosai]